MLFRSGVTLSSLIQETIGVLLNLISAVILPAAARSIAIDPAASYSLIMFGRLAVMLAIPAAATTLLHSDCGGQWVYLWTVCRDDSAFNIDISVADPGYPDIVIQVVKHSSICTPAFQHSTCARAVIGNVGDMLLAKLLSGATLAPFFLLATTSIYHRARSEEHTSELQSRQYRMPSSA